MTRIVYRSVYRAGLDKDIHQKQPIQKETRSKRNGREFGNEQKKIRKDISKQTR